MSEPVIRGWCPGALRPMESGDGWVVRIRPLAGRLTRMQADGLARLALQHGNGLMDVTTRANIQLRGVSETTFEPLIRGLADLGLLDDSAETEARRNIIVTPFWARDDGVREIATRLATAVSASDAPRVPAKFGFAVDCGSSPVLTTTSADIRLERGVDGGLICRADGATRGARVSEETAVATAMALARWFIATGGMQGERGRMARHLTNGPPLPERFRAAPAQAHIAAPPRPGAVAAGLLVGVAFGQLRAETLIALARHGALRITPWRMLLIEGLSDAPAIEGLITRPDDPMLRVIACSGKPDCIQGLQPTRQLARRLAEILPDDTTLHVSGCAKGCAHAGRADITVTGRENGFDVVRNGRAGDQPVRTGLTPEALVDDPTFLREVM
jgi:precorrin-3B synthase